MILKGETMASVTEVSIEAFKDIHEPQKKNWIYRGQRNFSCEKGSGLRLTLGLGDFL